MRIADTPGVPIEDEPPAPKAKKAKATANPRRTTLADASADEPARSLTRFKPDRPSVAAYATLTAAAALGLVDWPVALLGAGAWALARATR
jgi:hypothetical protein